MSAGRRSTRVNCARLAVLSVICLLGGGIAAGPARAESTVLTEIRRFDVPASTSQIVVAHADDFVTSYATVETFERVDGTWRRAFDPMPARFGAAGSVPGEQRVQGSHQTPAGIYTIPSGFGHLGSPGGGLPWRVVDGDDYWVYDRTDPATYNTYQTSRTPQARWRTSRAEHLRDYPIQYAHSLILGFNLPGGPVPVDVTAGGGIFLHVNGSGATAGCISLAAPDVAAVARWLDPVADPRIVIGPRAWLAEGDRSLIDATPTGPRPSAIMAWWEALGAEASFLGPDGPVEYAVPGGAAQDFPGGRIFWSTGTGARSVRGEILTTYATLGATATPLGFPVSDQGVARDGGAYSLFSGGKILWHPETGAHRVWGAIGVAYDRAGAENGDLGYPLGGESAGDGVTAQRFAGGTLTWDAVTGAVTRS